MYQTRGPIFPMRARAIATRSGPPARPSRTGAGTPGSEKGQLPTTIPSAIPANIGMRCG